LVLKLKGARSLVYQPRTCCLFRAYCVLHVVECKRKKRLLFSSTAPGLSSIGSPVIVLTSPVHPRQADELVRVSPRCIFHCFFLGHITSLPFSEAVRKFESRMPLLCCFVLVRPLSDTHMRFTFKANLFGMQPHHTTPVITIGFVVEWRSPTADRARGPDSADVSAMVSWTGSVFRACDRRDDCIDKV
jgi:hypothetical protein